MIESKKNILMSWDDASRCFIFDSIPNEVYVDADSSFIATGLVIGGEYFVTAEEDGDGDLILRHLVRADDDPLLGKEGEKHRG